jgi:hypothetical protein
MQGAIIGRIVGSEAARLQGVRGNGGASFGAIDKGQWQAGIGSDHRKEVEWADEQIALRGDRQLFQ